MSRNKLNVIFSAFNDQQHMVVDALACEYGWNPILILCAKRMKAWANKNYKDAVFVESMELRNAKFDFEGISEHIVPIDAKLIEALAPYESFTLDLLEDTTGWNFSFHERRRYYYDLLRYWNTVLVSLKPDIVVSGNMPHTVTEYVLYRMCVYYGIKIFFVNTVPTFNYDDHKFHHVTVSLEDQSTGFYPLYCCDEKVIPREEIVSYLNLVRSKKGMTPPYIAYFWNNQYKQWDPFFMNKWAKEGWRCLKSFVTGKFFEPIDVAWKKNRHPFDSPKSKLSYFEYIIFKEKIRFKDKQLKRIYDPFVQKADLTKKYIYYAAAFQPEAGIWTTYQDQLLILDIISEAIPEDWVIYYKEHPSQFMVGSKGSSCRSRHYYEKIAGYRNVKIISSGEDTFKLIDGAQAVVTPAGTVGWESIVRGIPALIFSPVWYQGCKSIFKINTFKDCCDAITKIRNGFKPDPLDIERFSECVARVSAKDIIHGEFFNIKIKECADPKQEMGRIAKLFYDTYERTYQGNKE